MQVVFLGDQRVIHVSAQRRDPSIAESRNGMKHSVEHFFLRASRQPSLYIQINQVGPYAFDKQCHEQDVKDHPEQPVHPVFVQHVFQNELGGER